MNHHGMQQTREVIVELLSQLSGNREAREYLQRFSSVNHQQFAVVKIGGGVLAQELDSLASALAFLRHVGLFPIVLHGAGPQLNEALEAAEIPARFIDNMRVTSPAVMKVARPVIYRQSQRIAEALTQRGVMTRIIQHGVFEAEYLDRDRYGLVGRVEAVHTDSISAAIGAGALPVVSCFGETGAGQVLNINADVAAQSLVKAIRPHKVVFLTPTGGLLDQNGKILSSINLATDYEALLAAEWVHSGMQLKLEQIKQLLDDLPLEASVSITSAAHLTRELFTHRGCGTLIRRGETFARSPLGATDVEALRGLLERCFGRSLKPGYFAGLENPQLIHSSKMRAAAIITRIGEVAYMDKFAVTPAAQGEGLGAALWQQTLERYPRLLWRSRLENPINGWYQRQAETAIKRGPWQLFSVGKIPLHELEELTTRMTALPESWLKRGPDHA
ncbi:MAG: acetylglutamate kinase [Acidobacteriota bacterium]